VTPGGDDRIEAGNQGADSAITWGISVSAEYDLALGFPEGEDGTPLSLVPIPELLTDGDGRVTGMNLCWVASDGSNTISMSDPTALDILVGKMEFFVQHNAGKLLTKSATIKLTIW
jgi:hypothetical protein